MGEFPYRIDGTVEISDRPGGWHFVAVPVEFSEELADLADRGLIPVRASIGQSIWDTSLLPYGDGTHFVALNSSVRRAEGLDVGDRVTLLFSPREP